MNSYANTLPGSYPMPSTKRPFEPGSAYAQYSHDGHPLVGHTAHEPHLYSVASHSGVHLAPLLGWLAATEIADGTPASELSPHRPDRPAEEHRPDVEDESTREMNRVYSNHTSTKNHTA